MKYNRVREFLKSWGNNGDAQAIIGAKTQLPPRTKGRVPPTTVSTRATQNPSLSYQVQDEHGVLKTYFETHPNGNRQQRRYRSRHHPYFTKTRTGGRLWQVLIRDASRARSLEQKK